MNNLYSELFSKQRANQYNIAQQTYKQRIEKLNRLKKAIEVTYRKEILDVLFTDLGKPQVEAELSEIYQIVGEIRHAKRNLRQWMQKQTVHTPLSMLGASSYYIYEPKGVCLIVSPWNFPFNLTFGPLVSAIAAGNTAIIKPSEMTPNCSVLMGKMVRDVFTEDEVAVVEGGVEVSTNLLKLPFNHIFFTGSPAIGKIIMTAAAKHLASVTLELGGKSPTLIDSTVNIDAAAKRIMWGKFMNAGQICVAPDYVLIDQSIKPQFVASCKKWLDHYFTKAPEASNSYGRIVNQKHFERLQLHIENAKILGAKIEIGGKTDFDSKYVAPTIVSDLKEESTLLHDEIFGPILPIVTYTTLNEALEYVNSKERPLALYIYSKSKANIKKVLANTRAGSTCINQNVIQYSNHYLPFGGVNNSGIGKSHGFYGFKAFSNERAIVKQGTIAIAEILFPPYNKKKERIARLTRKWF